VDAARQAIEAVFREQYGAILAGLIRQGRDFELAEEALQDALTVALERWPAEGTPANAAAWLAQAARRRLIDKLRRRRLSGQKYAELGRDARDADGEEEDEAMVTADEGFPDDRLRLIFTCCHPALAHEAQVALTLNTLCGLKVPEIARAFLTREPTLAQRLVRAKRKIKEARIPYRVPPPSLLAERLPAVLAVVYLVFNEGYASSAGDDLVRRDLCAEALRLGRLLVQLLPDEPEIEGLLALMLLQDSRREARMTSAGDLVLLEDQDRSRWDATAIDAGTRILERALARGAAGPYQIQAAIAALHARAPSTAATDWAQIVQLYDALLVAQPSPVVALNRVVAVTMAQGPAAGWSALEGLDTGGELAGYLYLHATRADLLRRLGRHEEACDAYRHALKLATNAAEQRFLKARLSALQGRGSSEG
jgi:RNA polymerase sigma-70 factor (ECF subfamily)